MIAGLGSTVTPTGTWVGHTLTLCLEKVLRELHDCIQSLDVPQVEREKLVRVMDHARFLLTHFHEVAADQQEVLQQLVVSLRDRGYAELLRELDAPVFRPLGPLFVESVLLANGRLAPHPDKATTSSWIKNWPFGGGPASSTQATQEG